MNLKKNHTQDTTGVEMVDWVATDNLTSIISLPRKIIQKFNLFHKGIGVIVVDHRGRIFIHKRSSSKKVFPSMYDMFIGGVCSSGEPGDFTLKRELSEEVGINTFDVIISMKEMANLKGISNVKDFCEFSKKKPKTESDLFYIGDTTVLTSYNHCLVLCYVLLCNEKQVNDLRFIDGEIDSGEWMSLEELIHDLTLRRNDYVPDGLQVWDNFPIDIY